MKKLTAAALALILLCSGIAAVFADDGPAGHIYSTDILAYVNGQPINSYNIGGKTVIIAEDLDDGNYNYGYTCCYNDEERLLTIESYFAMPGQKHEEIPRGQTGRILGDVYKSDIKVTYNGIEVTGYNIGGRTAVCIEEIGDITGSPHEAYGYSKYPASFVWNPEEKTISLNSYCDNSDEIFGFNILSRVAFTFSDNVLYARSDDNSTHSCIYPSVNGVRKESEEGAHTFYFTKEFGDRKYAVSPLYLDIVDSRTEIGTCMTVRDKATEMDRTHLHINDPAAAIALAASVKTPVKTYDEAIEFLTGKYELTDRINNDDYTVLLMKDEAENDLVYAVKKSGGCLLIGNYTEGKTIGILFGKEQNELIVTVYPFADNHGHINTLQECHLLDEWYTFD